VLNESNKLSGQIVKNAGQRTPADVKQRLQSDALHPFACFGEIRNYCQPGCLYTVSLCCQEWRVLVIPQSTVLVGCKTLAQHLTLAGMKLVDDLDELYSK